MIEEKREKYPNIAQSFGIVGIIILSMIIFSPLTFIGKDVLSNELVTLIYYLLSMGVAFLIVNRIRKRETGFLNYNFSFSNIKTILLVIITIIAIQIGLLSPIVSLLPMPDFMKQIFLELSSQNGVLAFITIVVAAPVLEELIFRGIILDGLLKKYSPLKSIVVSSLLFGLVHLNPWQFITATLIGFFSGWVYYRTQKLTLSIIIHMANNLFAFVSMSFVEPEAMFDQTLVEAYGGGMIYFILITIGAIALSIMGIYFLNKEFNGVNTQRVFKQ